jgi:hypothetical protein
MGSIREAIKMFYDTLTGKVTSQDITDAGEDIRLWYQIYGDESFGDVPWRKYSYVSLDGRPHERKRAALNAAKVVCSDLAGLIWAERPDFASGPGVEQVLKDTRFWECLPGFTERAIVAGGGGAFKLYGANGKLFIDFVTPDNFFPVSWDASGRITEADFVEKRTIDNKKYVRVEKHRRATRSVEGENGATGATVAGYEIKNVIFEEASGKYAERDSEELYAAFKVSRDPVFFGTGDVPLFAYVKNPKRTTATSRRPLVYQSSRTRSTRSTRSTSYTTPFGPRSCSDGSGSSSRRRLSGPSSTPTMRKGGRSATSTLRTRSFRHLTRPITTRSRSATTRSSSGSRSSPSPCGRSSMCLPSRSGSRPARSRGTGRA